MTWFFVCEGHDLRQCATCRRNVANQTLDVAGEHQSHMVPQIRNHSCADYVVIPVTPQRVEDVL